MSAKLIVSKQRVEGVEDFQTLFFLEKESTAGPVSCQSIRRVVGLESGTFRAIHRPEAANFGTFWRFARGRPEGLSARAGVKPDANDLVVWIQHFCTRPEEVAGAGGTESSPAEAGRVTGKRGNKPRVTVTLAVTARQRAQDF